jgi:murein DD-endopeptidase MepM/ murein hydrolase activator NlpD
MPRWPTGSFSTHRTGCYGCVRLTTNDGACGVSGYPCVHWGMDLFADVNQVVAPDSGTVVAVSDGNSAPWVGYGPGVVVMLGDSGRYLLMGHLNPSTIGVSVGQRLAEGDLIAQFDPDIGHTHFEVREQLTGASSTNTINPSSWVGGLVRTLAIAAGLGLVAWWLTRRVTTT